jgi:hypothetical protein
MNVGPIHVELKQKARSLRLKAAVFASFTEPAPSVRARLGEFTTRDWSRAKFWLDVSGLALYFLDRLVALDLQECIPESTLRQLHQDLADNRDRTAALIQEALTVNTMLRGLNINFTFLKGLTLPKESVPESALRNQADLDILVREQDARRVKTCLQELGYDLDVVIGSTWEFKAGRMGVSTIRDLYRVRPERSIDMRLAGNRDKGMDFDRLMRMEWRRIQGIPGQEIACLSPADIVVQQGQHIFKHMCSEFIRASWVLEFWRHVCARKADAAFWREIEKVAVRDSGARVAIGAATLLTTLVFGPFAPPELSRWSMDQLPPAICLWIQLYGQRVLFLDTPRSKLYLLLQKQLNPDSKAGRIERRRRLFPLHLPQRITRPDSEESIKERLSRNKIQALFGLRRLRFHLAQGLLLAIEGPRWERRLSGVAQ